MVTQNYLYFSDCVPCLLSSCILSLSSLMLSRHFSWPSSPFLHLKSYHFPGVIHPPPFLPYHEEDSFWGSCLLRINVNTLRPALHFCGANADYRCDRHSTFVATGLSPHKIASCISANQNCSRPFLRVTVEILLLHQPLKSYKLQYKYFAVF